MTLREQVSDWLPEARGRLAEREAGPRLERVGRVVRVADGVATVRGLSGVRLDELLRFADGTLGIAFRVDEQEVGCILLDAGDIRSGTEVRGSGDILRVPVGDRLLGRVVDPMGRPLDDGPPIDAEAHWPIERPAPGLVDREMVTQPLMTGLTVVDAMIPLGRGQRELIIGDRKTGKTALVVDAMINQRDSDVICVYVSVGQKTSTVNHVIDAVRRYGAIERCIFVVAPPEAPPGSQWIAPYAACSMAEYFRDSGRDALLVIDDLSHHAIVYRQLSLLLRRPPGREAYPGDVFYIHARLLERAARLNEALGGGSLTALPIAETQAGDLSAYIPTNLISITDGQIYLETKLFYEGQKPALNVGLSVSRVGGKTQAPAIKELAGQLRLAYAQFVELEMFTRFGSVLDPRTRRTIERGRRVRAVLAQPEYEPLPLAQQVALLLALGEGRLDDLPLEAVDAFKADLAAELERSWPRSLARIGATGSLADDDRAALLAAVDRLAAAMPPPQPAEG